MTYQKCPVCDGTGAEPRTDEQKLFGTCTVCRGAKIIHTGTGLPPGEPKVQGEKPNLNKMVGQIMARCPSCFFVGGVHNDDCEHNLEKP